MTREELRHLCDLAVEHWPGADALLRHRITPALLLELLDEAEAAVVVVLVPKAA